MREKGTQTGEVNMGFFIFLSCVSLILSVWAEEVLLTYFPRDVGT